MKYRYRLELKGSNPRIIDIDENSPWDSLFSKFVELKIFDSIDSVDLDEMKQLGYSVFYEGPVE